LSEEQGPGPTRFDGVVGTWGRSHRGWIRSGAEITPVGWSSLGGERECLELGTKWAGVGHMGRDVAASRHMTFVGICESRAGSKHMSCILEHSREYKSIRIASWYLVATCNVGKIIKLFSQVVFSHMLDMKSVL